MERHLSNNNSYKEVFTFFFKGAKPEQSLYKLKMCNNNNNTALFPPKSTFCLEALQLSQVTSVTSQKEALNSNTQNNA